MEAKQLLDNSSTFAVIGVTENKEKYGYKIYQCLKRHYKQVYGISPMYKEIDGDKIYPNLKSLSQKIEVAVFVVSPKYGYDYVQECIDLGIKHLWLQPGTYDDKFLQYLDTLNIHYYLDCVLRQLNC